ncbi:MAG: GDYXXLXY domain-containing protein [Verrucomicrobiales bacterium]|nr:GDYXXLXY domain-containing protein [Verrucomicrobiales bacterium]MCP5558759.1 GDYXXLXY domain-containing protein [Verrucomicrobiaceae bacterium]
MKSWMWIAFAVAVLAQWAMPLTQILRHEKVLTQGALVKLRCTAPDPYDPLRGRFLRVSLQPDHAKLPAGVEVESGATIYVKLLPGEDGVSTIADAALSPGDDGVWAQVKVRYNYSDATPIEWPIDRFYVNEVIAPEADKWLAENLRNREAPILAEVRVLDGRMVLENLSVDGRSFREILRETLTLVK